LIGYFYRKKVYNIGIQFQYCTVFKDFGEWNSRTLIFIRGFLRFDYFGLTDYNRLIINVICVFEEFFIFLLCKLLFTF